MGGVMCYGSSHGRGHLFVGHSLWGIKNGCTHVIMGSLILRRLAYVQNFHWRRFCGSQGQVYSKSQVLGIFQEWLAKPHAIFFSECFCHLHHRCPGNPFCRPDISTLESLEDGPFEKTRFPNKLPFLSHSEYAQMQMEHLHANRIPNILSQKYILCGSGLSLMSLPSLQKKLVVGDFFLSLFVANFGCFWAQQKGKPKLVGKYWSSCVRQFGPQNPFFVPTLFREGAAQNICTMCPAALTFWIPNVNSGGIQAYPNTLTAPSPWWSWLEIFSPSLLVCFIVVCLAAYVF